MNRQTQPFNKATPSSTTSASLTLLHSGNRDSFKEVMAAEDETDDQSIKKNKHKASIETAQLRRDLSTMLVGYGDVRTPRQDTVDVLVELTLQYLNNLLKLIKQLAPNRKISLDVLNYIIRNDQPKFMRIQELLKMNEVLKNAKKNYSVGDES